MVIEMALKAADIAHPCKAHELHMKWSTRITEVSVCVGVCVCMCVGVRALLFLHANVKQNSIYLLFSARILNHTHTHTCTYTHSHTHTHASKSHDTHTLHTRT